MQRINQVAPVRSGARCPICDWPMADSRDNGCVLGDCCYRPDDPAEQRRLQERRAALAKAETPNAS